MTKNRTGKRSITASPKKVAAVSRQSRTLVPSSERAVEPLIERVVAILEEARAQVVRTVNTTMVLAYWHVGREIVEFVQRGAKGPRKNESIDFSIGA